MNRPSKKFPFVRIVSGGTGFGANSPLTELHVPLYNENILLTSLRSIYLLIYIVQKCY